MKYLIVSDLHPDASTAGYPRFADVESALFTAMEVGNVENVDGVIFAGDLLTNDPSLDVGFRCVELLCRALRRSQAKKKYVIPGNHDVFEDGRGTTAIDLLRYEPGVRLFKKPELCDDIVFLPYTPASHRYDPAAFCENLRAERPSSAVQVKLVVGHLNLEGINVGSEYNAFPRGREVFFPIEEAKRCFPKAVLVNGHIHKRQVYRGVHVVGSLVRLTKTEAANEPGGIIVDV